MTSGSYTVRTLSRSSDLFKILRAFIFKTEKGLEFVSEGTSESLFPLLSARSWFGGNRHCGAKGTLAPRVSSHTKSLPSTLILSNDCVTFIPFFLSSAVLSQSFFRTAWTRDEKSSDMPYPCLSSFYSFLVSSPCLYRPPA